jgi:chromosome partitioning protein
LTFHARQLYNPSIPLSDHPHIQSSEDEHMRSIAFLSQKGGSGKTTLAVHIAVAAQAAGEHVVLIDTDPQGSGIAWGQARKSKPPIVHRAIPSLLGEVMQKAKQDEATLAIVDTPPHATPGMDVVAGAVDLLLIPCRPSAFDLAAITSSVQVAKAAGTRTAFVLNGCNHRSPEYNEARKVLTRHGFPVCPIAPGYRTPFVRAISTGRAVSEFEPKGKATEEIHELWEWVNKALKEK